MNKAVQHINFFSNVDQHKADYWKRFEQHRSGWERKYLPIIKRTLNREFKKVADAIDVTNFRDEQLPQKLMSEKAIQILFEKMYGEVGSYFARQSYRMLKLQHPEMSYKEGEELTDYWREEMERYARVNAGKKITSIAAQNIELSRSIIGRYLQQSTDEGWGAEETARAIRKGLLQEGVELNGWRSLRIARTEIMTASNRGAMKGAESSDLPLEKYWISTYDDRTRDTHRAVEQQNPKDMTESFQVGAYQMDMPGDERGGAEEVINCRCTVAFEVKRME